MNDGGREGGQSPEKVQQRQMNGSLGDTHSMLFHRGGGVWESLMGLIASTCTDLASLSNYQNKPCRLGRIEDAFGLE